MFGFFLWLVLPQVPSIKCEQPQRAMVGQVLSSVMTWLKSVTSTEFCSSIQLKSHLFSRAEANSIPGEGGGKVPRRAWDWMCRFGHSQKVSSTHCLFIQDTCAAPATTTPLCRVLYLEQCRCVLGIRMLCTERGNTKSWILADIRGWLSESRDSAIGKKPVDTPVIGEQIHE